ncbi:phospholipase D-like domain-containing protein [Bacteroides acidifaciens]|uniref:phospholipase D-like domain-containing protein n=2 Tax=Bacteroides acidifaciens TaxID=85831 RepID=UPI00214A0E03|nr:phospholipase D-like domain-containing protein [Bacteroides acidifaciens]MCR2005662.1 phospholipase D-like domain-containing protein [Bacteroides acidifaciens]
MKLIYNFWYFLFCSNCMDIIRYVKNEEHYALLMDQVNKVKHTLWIGTADLKDLYVKSLSSTATPFLQLLEEKVKEKVAIRLIHAKEPGTNFRADFDKYPLLWTGVERVLCPRVHFKILVFDMQSVYIGSANMTGAAFGMKSTKTRNFEAGIFTEFPELVESAVEQFDEVWMGKHCKECGRKLFCGDRVV